MLEEKNSIFLAYIKFTGIFLKADWYRLLDHFLQNLERKIRYKSIMLVIQVLLLSDDNVDNVNVIQAFAPADL